MLPFHFYVNAYLVAFSSTTHLSHLVSAIYNAPPINSALIPLLWHLTVSVEFESKLSSNTLI